MIQVTKRTRAVVSAAAEEDLPPYACGNVFVADADEVFQVQ
jgi:hypothetical protein